MSLLHIVPRNIRNVVNNYNNFQVFAISSRKLSIIPSLYDGEQDPGPKFFCSGVQAILKRLTRPDFAKVFRKRTNSNLPYLKTPKYKFLTDEEVNSEIAKANNTAARLLQMPPVVKVHEPTTEVFSKDPALAGYDTTKYLFTDITFGVPNEHRLIVERNPDGTLQSCDHDTRKRLNQGRKVREPLMFSDEEKFNGLLEEEKYEYILDRACIQYEPDEPSYQKITSITYQHIDTRTNFNVLRSTRHFGPMAFYLTWNQSMDNLMLELIQTGFIRESVLLMGLRQAVLEDISFADEVNGLVPQILPSPVQLKKPENLSEEDINIDNKCIDCVATYIAKNSAMKSQQELALQGFREDYQQLVELSRGLRKAHGTV